MVEKFKKILLEVKKNRGPVNVFAIIKMDGITDKWSVVFSAPWVEQSNASEVFNYLRELLLTHLSTEEMATVFRLSILSNSDHLIQLILKSVGVVNGEINLKETTLNGYKIHEAYIFESNLLQGAAVGRVVASARVPATGRVPVTGRKSR